MSQTSPPVVLRFGDFILDPQHFALRRAGLEGAEGETLHLQPKTFDLLHHLLRHPGRVVEKDELLAAVWPGVLVTEHSLTRCIKDLRRALGDDAAAPRYIETVARRGYRLMVVPQAEATTLAMGEINAAAAVNPTLQIDFAPEAARSLPQRPPAPWWRSPAMVAAALAVVVALVWAVLWRNPPAPVASIAVLPFSVLSATAADGAQLFADGVAEDVLDRLAQLPRLQVVARTSSFAFRDAAQDAKRIGRALGVLWLLEGSVRRDGERVVVSAQLVDASSGYRRWNARFERPLSDLFALQDEIARSVAAQVVQRIEPGTPLPEAHRSAGVEAWQHYMLARELFNRRTQDWQPRARQALEQALALEPGFSRALALFGIVVQIGDHRRGVDRATPALAEQAVQRALADDPRLGLAHAAAGLLRLQQGDHTGADTALQRALELDPMLVIAHNWRAIVLTKQGRIAESDAQLQAGLRIDPLNPVLLGNVGVAHEREGRPDEARRSYLRMLELPARPTGAYYSLLALDRDHGRLAEALRWALAIESEATPRWGALAAVPTLPLLAALGLDEAAVLRLQALQGQAVPPAVFRAYEAALLRLGRHGEVEAAAQATMAGPREMPAWWVPARASSLALRGQLPAALATLATRSSGPNPLSDGEQADHRMAVAWAQLGAGDAAQRSAAQQDIAQIVTQADAGRLESSPAAVALHALAHALAGDEDGAVLRLERAQAAGFNDHRWLALDPRWAALRTQPRFQAVLAAAQAAMAMQRDEVRRRVARGDRDYAALAAGTPVKP
jgi:TolB-like protein/DNA-binding winged helix-turn-helix (wHTH) protein/tetratricopeptide (TPR) repeat protein